MAASGLLLADRLVIRRAWRMLVLPPDSELNSRDQQHNEEMVCFDSCVSIARFTDRPALVCMRALHVRTKSDTHRRQVQLGPCVCLGHSQVFVSSNKLLRRQQMRRARQTQPVFLENDLALALFRTRGVATLESGDTMASTRSLLLLAHPPWS
jgi:hypothetical protein